MYLAGYFVSCFLNLSVSWRSCLAVGFVGHIAVMELFGWWMVAFQKPFYLFALLACCIFITGTAGGIFLVRNYFRENKGRLYLSSLKAEKEDILLLGIFIILCVFLFLMYRSDADDSFYVSNVLLFSKSDILNPYDSSFGNPSLGTVPMYDFQVWESYLAVLCRASSIKASVMCHYVMLPVLLAVSCSACCFMGDVLLKDHRKSTLFVCFLFLMYGMGGYSVYSKGSFLLSRIWQGKAVYLHIVLPVAIALMLDFSETQRKLTGILLGFVMLAGIGLNPTSMYVLGFQILFMMLMISFHKRDWRLLRHLLPALFAAGLFSVMILLRTRSYSGQIEAASSIPKQFAYHTFVRFLGEGWPYFLIYLACCMYILIRGEIKEKILCVYTPLLLLLAVWNPVMAPLIARYLTMAPSYWRVFWLLPMDYAMAYCAVRLIGSRQQALWKSGVFAFSLAVMILPGKFMFAKSNSFVRAENKERIADEILYLGNRITSGMEEQQIVLANEQGATTLRQEYDGIELVYSRYQYILDLMMYRNRQEEAAERIALMRFVNGAGKKQEDCYISDLLRKYQVKWILIDEEQTASVAFLEREGYSLLEGKRGLLLLCRDQ